MKVDRLLNLAEWGFNVPVFVHNPWRHYGDDLYLCLKEIFSYVHGERVFSVLATHPETGKSSYVSGLSLQSARLDCYSFETKGYEVLIFVGYPKEFSGSVLLDEHRPSVFITTADEPLKFRDVNQINNLVHRHIVREAEKVRKKVGVDMILVKYLWAKGFVGVRGSRLVFLDYRIE